MKNSTRYRLTLEYDGAPFHGWQTQPGLYTVQETLEHAIYQLTQETVHIQVAGRTDQGVHASGQVAHFDLTLSSKTEDQVRRGLNYYLKNHRLVVKDAQIAPPDFHARFSALFRVYEYRILNRPSPPILNAGCVWWVCRPLDIAAMRAGARLLEGTHDFSAFRAKDCQAKLIRRTLDSLTINRESPFIFLRIQSRSFLHQQVRIMVGTLKAIGEGRYPPEAIVRMLASRSRSKSGPTAPPQGLCLIEVGYRV